MSKTIRVAARPLASWDCGFEPRCRYGSMSLVTVVCCQVEVPVSLSSLVQMRTTECGVSECDREISITRRPRSTRGRCATGGGRHKTY